MKIHFSDFGAASNPRYLYGLAQLHQLERRRKGEDEDYAVVAIDLSTKDLVRKCLLVNVLKCFIIIILIIIYVDLLVNTFLAHFFERAVKFKLLIYMVNFENIFQEYY